MSWNEKEKENRIIKNLNFIVVVVTLNGIVNFKKMEPATLVITSNSSKKKQQQQYHYVIKNKI